MAQATRNALGEDVPPGIVVSFAPAGDLLQSHPNLHILATDGGFSAPYPALNYFLEAAIFAPGNSFDLHPYLEVRPARTVAVTAGSTWSGGSGRATQSTARAAESWCRRRVRRLLRHRDHPARRLLAAASADRPEGGVGVGLGGSGGLSGGGRHGAFLLLSLDVRL